MAEISNEKLLELKSSAQEIINVIEGLTNEGDEEVERRRMSLLSQVVKEGGEVTKEEWRELGQELGFDTRGLGGFFVGSNSMMQRVRNKRFITDSGVKRLRKWIKSHPDDDEEWKISKTDLDNL